MNQDAQLNKHFKILNPDVQRMAVLASLELDDPFTQHMPNLEEFYILLNHALSAGEPAVDVVTAQALSHAYATAYKKPCTSKPDSIFPKLRKDTLKVIKKLIENPAEKPADRQKIGLFCQDLADFGVSMRSQLRAQGISISFLL